ncbi:hypothetical protein L3X38_027372 [Prunus dulcis]|uniref:Uncharacterized protein n=1 Tax=Prunus dulcis TaxID=3755 RepID=A0AAD4VQ46_PRUDU|nr:hypothetical protein L3X38_027372 [Prunus dulcis]
MVMTLNSMQGLSIRRNIQRRIWKVSHSPEHPTPRVRLGTGEGGETIPQSPSLGGGGGGATASKPRFEPVELAAGVRSFRRGKRPRLDQDVEADRSGPVSGPAVAGAARTEERES